MNKEPLLIHVTAHVRLSVYLASDGDAAEICLFFRNGFYWFGVAVFMCFAFFVAGPCDGVCDDLLDIFIIVGWICFVSWAEIKDFALAAFKCGAASEYFAAFEPADKYEFVWCWDVKVFAVHFFFFEFDKFANASCNRVAWVDYPEAFFFVCFTPF